MCPREWVSCLQIGLEEAMANSPADHVWTKEQWEQILMDPQQFDLEDLEEVLVNAMQRAKACAPKSFGKGTSRGERVSSNGDDPRCQTGTPLDWEDWSEAAAGRGGD